MTGVFAFEDDCKALYWPLNVNKITLNDLEKNNPTLAPTTSSVHTVQKSHYPPANHHAIHL